MAAMPPFAAARPLMPTAMGSQWNRASSPEVRKPVRSTGCGQDKENAWTNRSPGPVVCVVDTQASPSPPRKSSEVPLGWSESTCEGGMRRRFPSSAPPLPASSSFGKTSTVAGRTGAMAGLQAAVVASLCLVLVLFMQDTRGRDILTGEVHDDDDGSADGASPLRVFSTVAFFVVFIGFVIVLFAGISTHEASSSLPSPSWARASSSSWTRARSS